MPGSGRDPFVVAGLTLKMRLGASVTSLLISQFIIIKVHLKIVSIVQDVHSNLYGFMFMNDSLMELFPYSIGVFQGDPLSVAIFNSVTCLLCKLLASEALVQIGYRLPSCKASINCHMFADDLMLLSNSPSSGQQQCHLVQKFLKWSKSEAKVVKCRSLRFRSQPSSAFYNTKLKLCGQDIPFTGDESTTFLGLSIDLCLSSCDIKSNILSELQDLCKRVDACPVLRKANCNCTVLKRNLSSS